VGKNGASWVSFFHNDQTLFHHFLLNRPEAFSTAFSTDTKHFQQHHQNAFKKFSDGPKLFQLFSKDPKNDSTAFPIDPKRFQ
jgi:hypothetical protein